MVVTVAVVILQVHLHKNRRKKTFNYFATVTRDIPTFYCKYLLELIRNKTDDYIERYIYANTIICVYTKRNVYLYDVLVHSFIRSFLKVHIL